jgi:Planctomycete extracellular
VARFAVPYRRRLRVEPLEERRLLAIAVNTLIDEADGSIVDGDIALRDAISLAPPGETINFSPALTSGCPTKIILTLGELVINKNLNINGPGANFLTIDASARCAALALVIGDIARRPLNITVMHANKGWVCGTSPR